MFAIGVAEGVWSHAVCRPERQLATVLDRRRGDRPVLFEARGFAAALWLKARLQSIMTELGHAAESASAFRVESAGLHNSSGEWQQLVLLADGKPWPQGCAALPESCHMLQQMPSMARRGQIKLSRLAAGASIRPHCGPTNGRLRIHCALVVPKRVKGATTATFWVGTEVQHWNSGECFVFDESCEHRAAISIDADSPRLVLVADIANPFLVDPNDYIAALVLQEPRVHRAEPLRQHQIAQSAAMMTLPPQPSLRGAEL